MAEAPGHGEDVNDWAKELAAAAMQIQSSITGDPQLHPGISAIAHSIVANALAILGDQLDANKPDVIKAEKILSKAVEHALELMTTDRLPTAMEIGSLRGQGITRKQYDALTQSAQDKSRMLQGVSIEAIKQELERLRDLEA